MTKNNVNKDSSTFSKKLILIICAIIVSAVSAMVGFAIGNKTSEIASLELTEEYYQNIYGLYEKTSKNRIGLIFCCGKTVHAVPQMYTILARMFPKILMD